MAGTSVTPQLSSFSPLHGILLTVTKLFSIPPLPRVWLQVPLTGDAIPVLHGIAQVASFDRGTKLLRALFFDAL
jgi:hypothetical protein